MAAGKGKSLDRWSRLTACWAIAIFSATAACGLISAVLALGGQPPAINPFTPAPAVRDDAFPGYVALSDGSIHAGLIYLTRDKRLSIYDEHLERQREVPLSAVKQIECKVKREWMEREWKFKEATSDEKLYTGRSYPAREYLHTITLVDGRTIMGPLSAIVYVEPQPEALPGKGQPEPEQFLLNKRDKGDFGKELKSLVYVTSVKLGKEALNEGLKKAAQRK